MINLNGAPVEGARVDVWSDNADGFDDVQQPGIHRSGTTAVSS